MSVDRTPDAPDRLEEGSIEQRLVRDTAALIQSKDDALDGATLSRLHQARSAAIENKRAIDWHWKPLTGAVAAAALVTLVLQTNLDLDEQSDQEILPNLVDAGTQDTDDLELLTSAIDLELLEDLDFYLWLESSDEVEA